jgi:membrane protein implicated in regulation of membrane protease activity
MKWIKTILSEIFGLFVDDAAFALAILIWLGLMRWMAPRLNLPPTAIVIVFFAGLALILIESTARYARRKR